MNFKKEMVDFTEKLKSQRTEDRKKNSFLLEHKFNREATFYQERIKTLDEIITALESVTEGRLKGDEVRMDFD